MIMGVETEVLRWFQQVADGATVTEAAELAMVSQPAVSRALARLEHEVGAPLLRREGRVLRLTEAGAAFRRHVDAAMHELDDGLAVVHRLGDPEQGTVTLSFQLSLGAWLVPQVVRRFRDDHPLVLFRLLPAQDDPDQSHVTRGRADVELTARRPDGASWRPLFAERLYLAAPSGHRLTQLEEVSLAEAAGEDFVMMSPRWQLRGLSEELCRAAGFAPRIVFESEDVSTARGLVAAGLGVAILPAMDADPASPRPGAPWLVRLTDPGASRTVGLAWSSSRRLLPAAELFRASLLAQTLPDH